MSLSGEKLLETLRCPACQGRLQFANDDANGDSDPCFECVGCRLQFPIINGVPRLLLPSLREALAGEASSSELDARQVETALSFGYEWTRFPEMYQEWEQSFLNYMQPHGPEFFRGKKV